MGHRNDDQYFAQGETGQLNDGFVADLLAGGAVSHDINDAQREALVVDAEPVAAWGDMWFSWLGKAPRLFVGALPDRFSGYWRASAEEAENSFDGSFDGSFS